MVAPLKSRRSPLLVLVALMFAAWLVPAHPQTTETNRLQWPEPTQTSKPWVRWWWPGSAVDPANLTRELEAFAAAGFGGVEITPIYGAKGAEEKYLEFLSPQYIAMLDHTTREARRLGLGVDMATGTGWPFGGPWVTSGTAMLAARYENDQMIGRPTRMKVKRAAPGGEGLVIDPYSTASLQHYLQPFSALDSITSGGIRAQFHDSFEYYGATWSEDLPARFQSMHGYAIQKYAAALLNQRTSETTIIDPDTLARVRADTRATLAAMHLDYIREWTDWSHRRGSVTRNQSHGAPANLLDLYGAVDIPETEMFGSTPFPIPGFRRDPSEIARDVPNPLVMRMASSAAHVMGKPLVSCEALTWLREHWHETFAAAKPELDQAFLAGVNHVFYHGACYSPVDAPWPGWFFYASTQINDRNPLWRDIAAFNAYVTRVQSVMQLGKPDNEILLYWPADDLWHDERPRAPLTRTLTVHNPDWLTRSNCGRVADQLIKAGYQFDFVSNAQLGQATPADSGGINLANARYTTLIIPQTRFMPESTLKKIADLKNAGANVFFEALPADVPGFADLETRRALFRTELARLDSTTSTQDVLHGIAGHATQEQFTKFNLQYLRRRHADGSLYFLSNLSADPFDGWIPIGSAFVSAALMDPLTGTIGRAAYRNNGSELRSIYLQLAPGESRILWTSTKTNELSADPWQYCSPNGEPIEFANNWRITFIDGGPEIPDPVNPTTLDSWTAYADPRAQEFAGTARYLTVFEMPLGADQTSPAAWLLDLGDVRETARVKFNGKFIGTVWCHPFRIMLPNIRPGFNTLEIEVTSLAANRIRELDRRGADWKIMRDANIANINYRPLNAAAWPAVSAGLLGPVNLRKAGQP